MFDKMKGQAATEYLIILAVVVIIALIVIGVLGGFPGMTRGISERESAAYWAGADVGIIRYALQTSSGNSQIVLRNNKNFQVTVTNITIGAQTPAQTDYTPNIPQNIAPGASRSLLANYSKLNCSSGTVGDLYTLAVTITYQDTQYGTTYTFYGEKPLVGTCQ